MKYYNNTDKVIEIKLPRLYKGLSYPKGSIRTVKPGEKIMIAKELLDYDIIPELFSNGSLSVDMKKREEVKKTNDKKPSKDKVKKEKGTKPSKDKVKKEKGTKPSKDKVKKEKGTKGKKGLAKKKEIDD